LKRVVHKNEAIFELAHCPTLVHKVATLNKIATVGKFCSVASNCTAANWVACFCVKHQIGLAKTRSNSKPLVIHFRLNHFCKILFQLFLFRSV
ncbi:hypothetical protein T10_11957, partial [Trichinella papuae]